MILLTLCGTRPEFIRLSRIIPKLDLFCEQILVNTGQNYDDNLSKVFFDELGIRKPDYNLGAQGSLATQMGIIWTGLEEIIDKEKPDRLLVLGDTNSSLGTVIAKRKGLKVYHMEAGNRCFDDKVPEEVNRRIIDHSSDILMPYTERSRQNLLDEGIHSSQIYVTGNPIKEVIDHYTVPTVRADDYYLVTLHREENVDDPERLEKFAKAFNKLDKPVIWPMHPRTKAKLKTNLGSHIKVMEPTGFIEFIDLERSAYCVLTDSGTVQEECAIFGKPVVTLRDSTERPETLESGSNFISGCEPEDILRGIEIVTKLTPKSAPQEYFYNGVSDTVVKIVLGK